MISEVTISGNTIQATVQTGGENIRIIGAKVARPQFADSSSRTRESSDRSLTTSATPDIADLINITGNILGGAIDKLIDASGDPSELRDNLLLRC